MNYYETLEVSEKADFTEIKKSYKKLAMKYHPDRNQGDEKAAEKFRKINEAYEIIGNEKKRKEYDEKRKIKNFEKNENIPKNKSHTQNNFNFGKDFFKNAGEMKNMFENAFDFEKMSRKDEENLRKGRAEKENIENGFENFFKMKKKK